MGTQQFQLLLTDSLIYRSLFGNLWKRLWQWRGQSQSGNGPKVKLFIFCFFFYKVFSVSCASESLDSNVCINVAWILKITEGFSLYNTCLYFLLCQVCSLQLIKSLFWIGDISAQVAEDEETFNTISNQYPEIYFQPLILTGMRLFSIVWSGEWGLLGINLEA